jgi:hypothetical protein
VDTFEYAIIERRGELVDRAKREEIENIVELTVARLDLKFTKAIGDLRLDIVTAISDHLQICQIRRNQQRQWNIGTLISVIAAAIAFGSVIVPYL